jgi:hypothetical protein
MLSAGLRYNGTTLKPKGIVMMFSRSFAVHGGFAPLGRVQDQMRSWALERLVCVCSRSPSPDLRWMLAALALHALAAVEVFIQRQLVRLARNTMGRALEGARFAGSLSAADRMVAAGGR